jgi:hypothetical protein
MEELLVELDIKLTIDTVINVDALKALSVFKNGNLFIRGLKIIICTARTVEPSINTSVVDRTVKVYNY